MDCRMRFCANHGRDREQGVEGLRGFFYGQTPGTQKSQTRRHFTNGISAFEFSIVQKSRLGVPSLLCLQGDLLFIPISGSCIKSLHRPGRYSTASRRSQGASLSSRRRSSSTELAGNIESYMQEGGAQPSSMVDFVFHGSIQPHLNSFPCCPSHDSQWF